jgi:hypothetical protein
MFGAGLMASGTLASALSFAEELVNVRARGGRSMPGRRDRDHQRRTQH